MCVPIGIGFFSFEKLDGCSVVMGDDRPYNMKRIGTVHIKMFDGMVLELKKVRYVPELKKNLIPVGVLKTLSLEISIGDGFLNMTKGSKIVLSGV